jgi:hypothetical protein
MQTGREAAGKPDNWRMKVKRLLTATAIALGLLTGTAHADSPASDHGYATAALEKVCFGMTVTDAKLRAKLDKKYRNTADFKDGYDWVTKRIDAAYKGWDYNLVIWQTCTNPAVTDAMAASGSRDGHGAEAQNGTR